MHSRLATNLLVLGALVPLAASAQVSVAINIEPPLLPLRAQPPVRGDGYIWTPGYWSWSRSDGEYYWVSGTWVLAPAAGYLWTPGYWGFAGAGYFWNPVGRPGQLQRRHRRRGASTHGGRSADARREAHRLVAESIAA